MKRELVIIPLILIMSCQENTCTIAPFDQDSVHMLPSMFADNFARDSVWLEAVPAERLLYMFRETAGIGGSLNAGVEPLYGWEATDCELRGHTTGHILSACAQIYALTGCDSIKAKADSLINGIREVQTAIGSGYVSAYPEEQIDRNIAGGKVWAPWYTLHKIMAGLLDQYTICGNGTALEILKDFAEWAYAKLSPLDENTRAVMLRNEFGGTPEAFWNLYSITGNEKHRWLAEFFYHNEVIDPLRNESGVLEKKHANTFIPKVLGEARNYEVTGNTEARKAVEYFWNTLSSGHMYCNGCVSDREGLFNPEHFSEHISGYTGETCCTYNLLKLARHIFCWTGDEKIAEYIENATFNHILGGQDPNTGMISYFIPLKTGTHKMYSTEFESFWCCVGSSFESHAKYWESIYFHRNNELFINMFIPSTLEWKEKGMQLSMTTEFPEEETITMAIAAEKPAKATIMLRWPGWCQFPAIEVNGQAIEIDGKPGSYIAIDRKWRDGDNVRATYPMELKFECTPDKDDLGALKYGPVVLAARLGTEGFTDLQPYSDPHKHNDYYTYEYNIPEINIGKLDIKAIKHQEGPHFTNSDGLVIDPLFSIHRERYKVYWER